MDSKEALSRSYFLLQNVPEYKPLGASIIQVVEEIGIKFWLILNGVLDSVRSQSRQGPPLTHWRVFRGNVYLPLRDT